MHSTLIGGNVLRERESALYVNIDNVDMLVDHE